MAVPLRNGCQALLALAVCQSLCAGNTPLRLSKKKVAAGAVTLLLAGSRALAAEPTTGMTTAMAPVPVKPSLPAVSAKAADDDEGFPMVWDGCSGPKLEPVAGTDSDKIATRVAKALAHYRLHGCAPAGQIFEAPICPEPGEFRAPSRAKSSKQQTAGWLLGPHSHDLDPIGHAVEAESLAIALDAGVCYALSEFEQSSAKNRERTLLNRLLEAGIHASKAEGNLKRSAKVRSDLEEQIQTEGGAEAAMTAHELVSVQLKRGQLAGVLDRFWEQAGPILLELLPSKDRSGES